MKPWIKITVFSRHTSYASTPQLYSGCDKTLNQMTVRTPFALTYLCSGASLRLFVHLAIPAAPTVNLCAFEYLFPAKI